MRRDRAGVSIQGLAQAFNQRPERFVNGMPEAKMVPQAVWINPPAGAGLSEGEQ